MQASRWRRIAGPGCRRGGGRWTGIKVAPSGLGRLSGCRTGRRFKFGGPGAIMRPVRSVRVNLNAFLTTPADFQFEEPMVVSYGSVTLSSDIKEIPKIR